MENFTKCCKCHDPLDRVLMLKCGNIPKPHYFFKMFLLYSLALVKQIKYKVMMAKEGSSSIVNFKNHEILFF